MKYTKIDNLAQIDINFCKFPNEKTCEVAISGYANKSELDYF